MMKIIYALKKIFFYLFVGIACIALAISTYHIVKWYIDNNRTNKEISNIEQVTTITETNDNDNTQIINNSNPEETDLYWKYINMNLINVDFNDLLKTNSDTVGWIQLPDTNINYPVVQTTDNDYYLNHSFTKKNNSAGWVFLDYRNNGIGNDKNSIIYAHGRVNGTMFGSLKNTIEGDWLNNSDNFVVKISTPTQNTLWQVFSTYIIPTTNDYIQVYFADDNEFTNWINKIKSRSSYNFNTEITQEDKIITLSTCYNNTDKAVLHAKLIKIETK